MNLRPATGGLKIAGEPRVQLLPQSVRMRAKNRETRQLLGLLAVLAVVIVAAGMTFGWLRSSQAQAALDAETLRTQEILTEQAEYAEVTRIAALVATSEEAQRFVTSNEFAWVPLFADVLAFVPAGATITQVAMTAPAPWEPALSANGPLRAPHSAFFDLEIGSTDLALAGQFVAAVSGLEGVADAVITSSTWKDGMFLTKVSLTFNEEARSGRFAVDEVDAESDGTEQSGASAEAAPTETEGVRP